MRSNGLLSMTCATFVVIAAACGGPNDAPANDQTDEATATTEQLNMAISADEGTLTPFTNKTGYPGSNLVKLIFDTLVMVNEDFTVTPLLASDVTTDDNQTFEIPLREGVTWHDGEPFTADDVIFTINYFKDRPVGDSPIDVSAVKDVSAEGNTVTITLEEPDPEFGIRVLAEMGIMPDHLGWQDLEDPTTAGTEFAIGTGPYTLTSFDPDRGYTLTANEEYALGQPKIGTIDISIIPEETTQFAALRTGEIDMSTRIVPPQQLEVLENDPNVGLADGVDFASTLLLFNTTREPFDQPDVRRALSMAIDVEDLVETVLLGYGETGNPGFIHPEAPVAGDQSPSVHDPEAAASALDALGAEVGSDGVRVLNGKPMRFELLVYTTSPDRIRSAELIKEMLAVVGVEVKVNTLDTDALDALVWPEFDVTKGRDYDMSMWGWSSPVMTNTGLISQLLASDPDVGRLNVVGYSSDEADAAIDDLRSEPELDGRVEAARRLQVTVTEDLPFLTLYYRSPVYGFREDVFTGWTWQPGRGVLNQRSFAELAAN